MNEVVQNKINQINKLAKAGMKPSAINHADIIFKDNNLSKSIRNAKEASVFMDELNAAIKIAQSR